MSLRRIDLGEWRRASASRQLLLALALLLLPALALAQTAGVPPANPRLSSLGIEIWPEYDRSAALVILRGAVAEDVKLPAVITLRLPAASGGPAAVAHSTTADGNLLNLKYERADAGDHVTLKFETPQRFFHVEFYEPISIGAPARNFRYLWPGDLAVERATVVIQEPVSASNVVVEPNLDRVSTGQDGLRYRVGELGALTAGKPTAIAVRYTKADARPSTEILKPNAAVPESLSAMPAPAIAASGNSLPDWLLPLAGLFLLSLLGGALILWRWRRESSVATSAATPAAKAVDRACTKCGAVQAPGNRFCGNCGTKIR